MPNQYKNKVVYYGSTLIDLSGDTLDASKVLSGYTGHDATGAPFTGSYVPSSGAISVVDTLDSAGGTIRTITAVDISDTTAVAADVAQGKYFYTAAGVKTAGTGTGGGGAVWQDSNGYVHLSNQSGGTSPSATHHEIHLEFSDSTDTDIDVYYNDSLISTMITAYIPATYNNKTVTLAELDGVAWYEPANIPMNTELIDYTAVTNGYIINAQGEETESQWSACSDFTLIDPTMTFSYIGYRWYYLAFYTANETFISSIYMQDDADSFVNDYAHGTFSGNKIPSNAMYVRISTNPTNPGSTQLSLIRTA